MSNGRVIPLSPGHCSRSLPLSCSLLLSLSLALSLPPFHLHNPPPPLPYALPTLHTSRVLGLKETVQAAEHRTDVAFPLDNTRRKTGQHFPQQQSALAFERGHPATEHP
eukprot:2631936-Rhodomonas_salina.2